MAERNKIVVFRYFEGLLNGKDHTMVSGGEVIHCGGLDDGEITALDGE